MKYLAKDESLKLGLCPRCRSPLIYGDSSPINGRDTARCSKEWIKKGRKRVGFCGFLWFAPWTLLVMLLCACSYTYPIGRIGDKEFYKVNLGSTFGPGQTMIVIRDTNNGALTYMNPIGGNGVLPSAVVAGSIIGGSYYIGKGLEKSGDRTTINSSSSAQSAAQAAGEANAAATANPSVTVEDGPLAPPIGLGPPFGSRQGWPRNNWSK